MDETWTIRSKAIHLNEFGQSYQLSNLDALRVTVERSLYGHGQSEPTFFGKFLFFY